MRMDGVKFGDSIVVQEAGRGASGKILWECRCKCGRLFTTVGVRIRQGRVSRCSDCARELGRARLETHGLSKTAEYWVLVGIKDRCYNPNNKRFERYGGRGIKVCKRWLESPQNFLDDMGPKPGADYSIERVDTDGNYEPSNCKWATRFEQANNRSNNKKITINGTTKNITEWASETGVCRSVIQRRLKRGLKGEALIEKHDHKLITVNGITDTAAGWGRRTGIKGSTISTRIRDYKWSPERAVTEGVKPCA